MTLEFDVDVLPVFPGALELAREGLFSGGARRGRASLEGAVETDPGIPDSMLGLCYDSETSGGLLIVLPPERAAQLERELAARDQIVRRVGECVAATGAWVELA